MTWDTQGGFFMRHPLNTRGNDKTALCGTLIHTAVIAGHAIEADVIGARLTGKTPADDLAYVCQIGPSAAERPSPELQNWPLEHDSPFSDRFMRSTDSGVSKLKPQTMDDHVSFMDCFRPFDALGVVVDAVSLRFVMPSRTTCSIVYLRCGTRAPFSGNNMWMLKHLSPVIAKDAQRAYRQWAHRVAWHSGDRLGPLSTAALTAGELLARLSKTELLVLDHLRLWETERMIAEALERSPHTVHVHIKSIYRKLMVTSRRQLLQVLDQVADTD